MQFLEHPGLSRLSALLKDLDVGDRVVCGRLELFSTSEEHVPSLSACPKVGSPLSLDTSPDLPSALAPFPLDAQKRPAESLPAKDDVDMISQKRSRRLPKEEPSSSPLHKRQKKLQHGPQLSGTHNAVESRRLLVQLVNTMNACFPDYDFR